MPLLEGSSDETISKNIAELMRTGKYDQKQAIAIAFSKAGRSRNDAKDYIKRHRSTTDKVIHLFLHQR
jgi:hypothetical protein